MPTIFRLKGLLRGKVDTEKRDVNFVLQVEDGRSLGFVAEVSAIEQIASALGALAHQVPQQKLQAIAAQEVIQYGVKREAFGSHVLLKLTTTLGVPHMFAIPLAGAADIAARLQKEIAKHQPSGNA